jgi:hypothetical protein
VKKLLVWTAILAVVAIVAGPASAGGKGGSSIELVRLSDTARLVGGDTLFGEQVTFDVSTSRTTEPYVWLACYRDGARVYSHTAGFFSWYGYSTVYTLGPTSVWTEGSANCEAQLLDRSHGNRFPGQVLARLSFQVVGG